MTLKNDGFRALYRRLFAVSLKNIPAEQLDSLPELEKADHILAYGFIDEKKGLLIEVLGYAKKGRKCFKFGETSKKRVTLQAKTIENEEVIHFTGDEFLSLIGKYEQKIAATGELNTDLSLVFTRRLAFLDYFRDEYKPDDVKVILTADGREHNGQVMSYT